MIRIARRCISGLERPLRSLKDWGNVLQNMEKLVYANGHGQLLPNPGKEESSTAPILEVLRSIKIQERLTLNGEPHLKPGKIEAEDFGDKVAGVTSILQKTMSENQREVLRRWRERMILEMGESGFKIYQRNLLEHGTDTHYLIECFAKENEAAFEKSFEKAGHDVKAFWKSVEPILRSGDVTIKESEYRIQNSQLPYTGIADSIGYIHKFGWCIIDWKTSQKRKTNLSQCFDEPLQIAAYAAALGLNKGALVKIYKDRPCDIIYITPPEMKLYWNSFLERFEKYAAMSYTNKKT